MRCAKCSENSLARPKKVMAMEPADTLHRLTERIENAIQESRDARRAAEQTSVELASERVWRRWTARVGALLAVMLIVGMGYLVLSIAHQDTLLSRTRIIGIENHQTLLAIQAVTSPAAQRTQAASVQAIIVQVVNEIDCRVRDDVAIAVHEAFPTVVVTLPATANCPAYSPKA